MTAHENAASPSRRPSPTGSVPSMLVGAGPLRTVIVVLACLAGWLTDIEARAQTPDRARLSELLREAEAQRARFDVVFRHRYHYPIDGFEAGEVEHRLRRIVDGAGSYRHERRLPEHGDSTRLVTWDGSQERGLRIDRQDGEADEAKHTLQIRDVRIDQDHLDRLETAFGLRLPYPRRDDVEPLAPSDAVAPGAAAEVRIEVRADDPSLVDVTIVGAWNGRGPTFRYLYDRDRNWLPLALEKRSYTTSEARASDSPVLVQTMEVVETDEVGAVEWPTRIDWVSTFFHPGTGRVRDRMPMTIRIETIDPNPVLDEATFRPAVADLPAGTTIVDHRHEITYRLGEPHLLVDGTLYDTGSPIEAELAGHEIGRRLENATRLADPNTRPIEPVRERSRATTIALAVSLGGGCVLALAGLLIWGKVRGITARPPGRVASAMSPGP